MHARAIGLALALTLATTATAEAQAPLDAAVAAFDDGEIERAGALLEQVDPADRAELVRVLTFRMLVAHALGQEEERDQGLFRLGTLIGTDALDGRVPPPVRMRFDSLREGNAPMGLEVSAERRGATAELTVRLTGDRAGMVIRVELAARLAGGPWRPAEHGVVTLPVGRDATVEYHARAISERGVELATLGSERAPLTSEGRAPDAALVPGAEGEAGEASSDDTVWIVLGVVGAVVLVGAGVTIGVVAATQEGSTRFGGPPMIEW